MLVLSSLSDPRLAQLLQQGAVGIIPTDTIYGLAASSHVPAAVERLYELKHREQKPGTTIAASIDQLADLNIGPTVLQHVAHLWPNPLSIELPLPGILEYIHGGINHAAFRVVADPEVSAMLRKTGPLTTSSANQPGGIPAQTVDDAIRYFGESVDFYVDGGDRSARLPSTVARLEADGTLTVFREGAVKIKEGKIVS